MEVVEVETQCDKRLEFCGGGYMWSGGRSLSIFEKRVCGTTLRPLPGFFFSFAEFLAFTLNHLVSVP
jgi:hypothetical protein